MGGERSSTARQRLAGKICCRCKLGIPDPPERPGERYCKRCRPKRQVYMQFMKVDGWYCQFLEADCKTPLPRNVTLKSPAGVRAVIERVSAMAEDELHDFERAVSAGRGSVGLMLTEEQYRKLLAAK